LGDAEGDAEAEAEGLMLLLLEHGGPDTRPSGCWKFWTGKLACVRPLLMKSLRTELPTMVPNTLFMFWLPGPVCPTQAPTTMLGA